MGTGGSPCVYGGLRSDASAIKDAVESPLSFETVVGGLLPAIDLPLSAALDTLLLPLTLVSRH